jgi:type II secretory pathway pseudopilin PulG
VVGAGPQVSDEVERLTVLQAAIAAYSAERGSLPPGPSSALVRALATPSKRGEPYLQIPAHALAASGDLLDGWGSPVCYRVLGSPPPGSRGYELYSFGANMKDENGAGDDVLAAE